MKRILPLLIAIIIGSSGLLPDARVFAASVVHTVVRGDTLYSLSRHYGTTIEAIMQVNHLRGVTIYVGQELTIPARSVPNNSGGAYTVVRYDTLYSIARRYGTTVDAIMRLNNLSSSLIYVGQRLTVSQSISPTPTLIPGSTIVPTASPTPTLVTVTPTATPNCDRSYPDFCLPSGLSGISCASPEIGGRRDFTVLQPDPYDLDGNDNDGFGCES